MTSSMPDVYGGAHVEQLNAQVGRLLSEIEYKLYKVICKSWFL